MSDKANPDDTGRLSSTDFNNGMFSFWSKMSDKLDSVATRVDDRIDGVAKVVDMNAGRMNILLVVAGVGIPAFGGVVWQLWEQVQHLEAVVSLLEKLVHLPGTGG